MSLLSFRNERPKFWGHVRVFGHPEHPVSTGETKSGGILETGHVEAIRQDLRGIKKFNCLQTASPLD